MLNKIYTENKNDSIVTASEPLITIITVVYNGEKYLEQTIQSVINQTYDNVEYIIIDGGSTDGTLDIIRKYEDKIDYWVSEKDAGIYDAMNKGIAVATGEWINFMNAGDSLVNENSLKIFSKYFDSTFALIYSDILIKNQITSEFTEHKQPIFRTWYGNYKMLCHQSILFNKKILIKFNIKYKISADFDLLLSLFKRKKLFSIHIQKPLISYLDGGCSGNDVLSSIQERMSIINEYESFLFKLIGRLNYYRLRSKFANQIKVEE